MMFLPKHKRIDNAGNPKGFWGKMTMRAMNRGHHKLTDWGLSFLTINGDEKILDIGCGGGRTVYKLARATAGTVWGVDASETAVSEAFRVNRKDIERGHTVICQASVSELPFDDDTFDIITAVETVYFWPDFEEDCKEVFRVMKHGAALMLLTDARADTADPDKWKKITRRIEMRLPTADGLAEDLKKAGFTAITAHIQGDALCVTTVKP